MFAKNVRSLLHTYHYQQIFLHEFPVAYSKYTGEVLQPKAYGCNNLEELLGAIPQVWRTLVCTIILRFLHGLKIVTQLQLVLIAVNYCPSPRRLILAVFLIASEKSGLCNKTKKILTFSRFGQILLKNCSWWGCKNLWRCYNWFLVWMHDCTVLKPHLIRLNY